jgi:hypothetical protein
MKTLDKNPPSPTPIGWPQPLARAALRGLVGKIVDTISPHSECDPAALVFGFLVAFGNEIGRGPHFIVERARHALNLFVLFIGLSSKGRKGTAQGYVDALFEPVIPQWADTRVQSGLSSGEGLAEAARRLGKNPKLLFVEPEFSSVQRAASRRGSTLCAILRQAWDGRPFQVATKHDPLRVDGAHFSLIGHETLDDLDKNLSDTDVFNGFAGRFLYVCTHRAQVLPFGGSVSEAAMGQLSAELASVLEFASQVGEIGLSPKAKLLWCRVYEPLSADVPGRVGAAIARAEAITRRVAALYALLDKQAEVKVQHLRAAVELWRFAADSARFIFGKPKRENMDDKIFQMLQQSNLGLTRTEISRRFHHHLDSDQITATLERLQASGTAKFRKVATGGRVAKRWSVILKNKQKSGIVDCDGKTVNR